MEETLQSEATRHLAYSPAGGISRSPVKQGSALRAGPEASPRPEGSPCTGAQRETPAGVRTEARGLALGDRYDGFMFDVDGVVYRQTEAVPDAVQSILRLFEAGKPVVFASNSSVQSTESAVARLRQFGLPVEERHVVVGTALTARLVAQRWPGAAVYVLGGENLKQQLRNEGLSVIEDVVAVDYRCDCLVVGTDLNLTYRGLKKALRVLLAGGRFVAVNSDRFAPDADGLSPAAGGLVAALSFMAGREPDVIVGKPAAPLLQEALARIGTSPEETLLVGDTLETDVSGGAALGVRTALVLTGNATLEDLAASPIQPDYVLKTLADLWKLG